MSAKPAHGSTVLAQNEIHVARQMLSGLMTMNHGVYDRLVNNLLADRRFAVPGVDKPGRDVDLECGYPKRQMTAAEYKVMYDRVGLFRRVINVYPNECWSVYPALFQTDDQRVTKFERAWRDLEDAINPWAYLHKIDVLSGIGRYGALYLGLPGSPEEPAAGLKPGDLAYLQTYPETLVQISKRELNPLDPRFGLPLEYVLKVGEPLGNGDAYGEIASERLKDVRAHWTRVVHVADGLEASRVYAPPRGEPVVNYVLDARKMGGADAEGYWQTGFPGYSVETLPGLVEDGEMDTTSAEEQWRRYRDELRRVMFMHGTTVKSLAPQVSDPTPHMMMAFQLICATIEVPMRIFLGSEAAHLASTQDSQTWNRRLSRRQKTYIVPFIIRPFVNRLIQLGVLPAPKDGRFTIEWQDLNSLSDSDKAGVALKRSQGLMQYISGRGYEVIRPFFYFTLVMGYTEDEATAMIAAHGGEDAMIERMRKLAEAETKPAVSAGGNRVGNPPRATPNRPAGS